MNFSKGQTAVVTRWATPLLFLQYMTSAYFVDTYIFTA